MTPDDKALQEKIRNELKKIVRKKGIKHLDLAQAIGISEATLSSFLFNGKDVRLITLGKIEQYVEKNSERE